MKFEFEVRDFNTEHIFECGQCFRWNRQEDGSYTGIAGGHIAKVTLLSDLAEGEPRGKGASQGLLVIEESCDTENAESKDFWKNYFDLGRDYAVIKKSLASCDDVIKDAIAFGEGIRILNQERWETLISFIISANNNIPRIKKNIEDLASNFGEIAGKFEGKTYYNIPSPRKLAGLTEQDLADCKLGYRARYIIKTAREVENNGGKIDEKSLPGYCGVGPKVANCIKLFSMGAYDSFPIDTWVEQVMSKLYGIQGKKNIAEFAKKTFGKLGGFAQQYLFYYMRSKG